MQDKMVVHNSQFELKTLRVSEDTKKAIRNVVFSLDKQENHRINNCIARMRSC